MLKILKVLVIFSGLVSASILTLDALDRRSSNERSDPFVKSPTGTTLISHAGGGLPQGDYSNSLEALQRAKTSGFTYFEVDFGWTTDNALVLVHDWNRQFRVWFEEPFFSRLLQKIRKNPRRFTRHEFMNLEFRYGLTQLDLAGLMSWVRSDPDVRIVTDIKDDNIVGLRLIASEFPDLLDNIIPQIYQLSEYEAVSKLGFTSIIFTSYRSAATPQEIAAFDLANELYAVTVPYERLTSENLEIFENLRAPLWTHTINDPAQAERLSGLGIDGFYTDYLMP